MACGNGGYGLGYGNQGMMSWEEEYLRRRRCGQASAFVKEGCGLRQRWPVWAKDGIKKNIQLTYIITAFFYLFTMRALYIRVWD